MNTSLKNTAADHILIAAHRGSAGGNIPCNTKTAYEIALLQKADIIEIDVEMSSDGKLIIFHPGMEKAHLGFDGRLKDIPYSEIEKLRFVNQDKTPTQFCVNTLDEILSSFGQRCFINVDKFWRHPKEIADAIRANGAQNSCIIKCSMNENDLDNVEKYAPDLMFMPVIHNVENFDTVLKRNINCIGAEICFSDESSPFASDEFIAYAHSKGMLLWVNAIVYNHKTQLSALHSDDSSFEVSRDYGWGWLADKGYDIIQTDWAGMCRDYLVESGKYCKK